MRSPARATTGPSRWRIRCPPSSTRCVPRSCRVWSTRSRTTVVTGGTMSGCSRSGRGFPAPARPVRWRSRGPARRRRPTGRGPRARSTSSTSKAWSNSSAARSASPRDVEPAREPFLVPGQTASLLAGDGTTIGVLGQVLPSVADARGLPRQDRVFVAEVNLDRLSAIPVAAERGDSIAAAVSVRRSRSVDCRRRTPCLPRSFVAPFKRPARRRLRRSSASLFSIAIRARGSPKAR